MSTTAIPERFEIADSTIFQQIGDETVILNLVSQDYYGLDDVGSKIFQLLIEFGNVNDTVRALREIYDADEDLLRADVNAIVEKLRKAKLLRQV